jgi:hypothetical protein
VACCAVLALPHARGAVTTVCMVPLYRDRVDTCETVLGTASRLCQAMAKEEPRVIAQAAVGLLEWMHGASFSDVHIFLVAPEGSGHALQPRHTLHHHHSDTIDQ